MPLLTLGLEGLNEFELKIITDQVQAPGAKPTEWIAYREGDDPEDDSTAVGRGASETFAIYDLQDI